MYLFITLQPHWNIADFNSIQTEFCAGREHRDHVVYMCHFTIKELEPREVDMSIATQLDKAEITIFISQVLLRSGLLSTRGKK